MIRRPPRSTLFPTRRSSDLAGESAVDVAPSLVVSGRMNDPVAELPRIVDAGVPTAKAFMVFDLDRKSTRLNSSHANISYAVFCLKKKINCSHGARFFIHRKS